MADSIDRVFVHALNTVKRLPRTGSATPPEGDRLKLYGLYKQSMEGDVEGVMAKPSNGVSRADQVSELAKWEAWHANASLSRTEAKQRYISTLIETMHRYATTTTEARELIAELEFVWDQIKSNPVSSSDSSPGRRAVAQNIKQSIAFSWRPGGDADDKLKMIRPTSQGDEELDVVGNLDETQIFQHGDAMDSGTADFFSSSIGTHNERWKQRVEQALVKMTVDIAALREQMEANNTKVTKQHRRPLTLIAWFITASMRHLFVDAVILVVLFAWARQSKGLKAKRGLQTAMDWIRRQFSRYQRALSNFILLSAILPYHHLSITDGNTFLYRMTTDISIDITLTYHGTTHTLPFSDGATLSDLSDRVDAELSIPLKHQKFMITPKIGILKPPFSDPSLSLSKLQGKKVLLLAPTAAELSSISRPLRNSKASSTLKSAAPARQRDWRKVQDETTYTFHAIIPLPYLPNPDRSKKFLERLSNDPGIKAAMVKHKFSVGVLTEMNPAEHTTHESKTLGLNRNRGEVIELRLRTDAYDGYRDYKIIRDTLCHELAHNEFGDHDRNFWDLTKSIEKEVRQNDWKSGGQAVSNEIFYDPQDREGSGDHVDGGGWSGGEFVLGGSGGEKVEGQGLGRREAMARAAEERMRSQKEVGKGGELH
ncbi:uncharacterized protein KY384_000274 [Bacidia gigantensis]|uniref:uncharacterized protein n=1 Tax=Bacidia gigantensis TaxID=2732470 RepID=UPI001D04FFDA|nr:uncharacterized protein KY384_000274 [Bacidia gigantensis]KAG8526281.1 hypothetical protein KY384_000274 [Bacidia gigantensis]